MSSFHSLDPGLHQNEIICSDSEPDRLNDHNLSKNQSYLKDSHQHQSFVEKNPSLDSLDPSKNLSARNTQFYPHSASSSLSSKLCKSNSKNSSVIIDQFKKSSGSSKSDSAQSDQAKEVVLVATPKSACPNVNLDRKSTSHKIKSRSSSLNSKTSTSTSHDSKEKLQIDYHTLIEIKTCPACGNPWTTYIAPKSKLSHIKKCARKELIKPRHITKRIQNILDDQKAQEKSLLDRHLVKKRFDISLIGVEASNSHNDQAIRKAIHQESNQKMNPPDSSSIQHHPLILNPKSQDIIFEKENLIQPKISSSPMSNDLRSAILKEVQTKTSTRNATVHSNGSKPCSLWELASCDDDFDYNRSSSASSHNKRNSLDDRIDSRPQTSTGQKDKNPLSDLLINQNLQDDEYPLMPSYHRWSRSQLKNENERLGYQDGSDVSTGGLIQRAKNGWRYQIEIQKQLKFKEKPIEISNNTSQQDEIEREERVLELSSSSGSQLDEINDLEADEDVEERHEIWSLQPDWYDQDDQDINWAAEILNSPVGPPRASSDVDVFDTNQTQTQPHPNLRPNYETYPKSELVSEFNKLKEIFVSQNKELELLGSFQEIPKTKPAILRRVIQYWDLIYHDNQDERIKLKHKITKQSNAEIGKKLKIIKQKVTYEELDELMTHICMDEPEFYLRILRYEPIQFSVFQEKLKLHLEKQFEKDLKNMKEILINNSSQKTHVEELREDGIKRELELNRKMISNENLIKWLDFQSISFFVLDPHINRKRY
ncbi:hypothetical protein O181_048670 [Austropuccinia psidii MF-1]|uniref:Uncharacterized protein n=1 Tax=Austropuccinia psidii MF-1 TaxID=1389203 RepID=A0A9Q3DXP4_9BASI|nr:hypothetical protein [Austropuccinia psidii MF-1]